MKENKNPKGTITRIGDCDTNQHEMSKALIKGREADEFSFVAEHIEDEPSIHIRSITQF
jgi:hypothetical protein